ncbi:MAG: hypothetical protein Q8K73_07940 [Anaerolineales bacterium]|nr:hypothetical protein [Anaerolineales bacterium]
METQRVTAGKEVESAWSAVYEVPYSGKKLEESVAEEERARLGK